MLLISYLDDSPLGGGMERAPLGSVLGASQHVS